jgi:hypothetical protein
MKAQGAQGVRSNIALSVAFEVRFASCRFRRVDFNVRPVPFLSSMIKDLHSRDHECAPPQARYVDRQPLKWRSLYDFP